MIGLFIELLLHEGLEDLDNIFLNEDSGSGGGMAMEAMEEGTNERVMRGVNGDG